MGEAHALPHQQTFDLVEHGGVGEVAVAPVNLAGHHYGHGRLARQHGAHLHGRRVGAHEHLVRNVQGVLHVAGGMFRRHIQGLKIVIVYLHFRPGGHIKAQPLEHAADFLHHQGGGVQAAAPGRAARNGRIKTLERGGLAPGFQSGLTLLKQGVAAFFDAVGLLPHGGARLWRKARQLAHDLGNAAFPPQNVHAQGFQRVQVGGLGQTGLQFGNQALQCRNQIHNGFPMPLLRRCCYTKPRRRDASRTKKQSARGACAPPAPLRHTIPPAPPQAAHSRQGRRRPFLQSLFPAQTRAAAP